MKTFLAVVNLIIWTFFTSTAQAQDRAWIQIEAHPTLEKAEERARIYAEDFNDVAGFRMASGWYAIALGPYEPDSAVARLTQLRRENLIPVDSFVAGGVQFRAAFWPTGRDPLSAPVIAAPVIAAPVTPATDASEPATPSVAGENPFEAAASGTDPAAGIAILKAEDIPDDPAANIEILRAEETPEQARQSESALSRDARMDLQAALQWFGFYNSTIDGAFGPGTRASMSAWQEAKGHEATGILTTSQRAQILAERDAIIAELGLAPLIEEEAGIEITLPLALVEFDRYEPPFVHFKEKPGSGLRVILISEPGDPAVLRGLYDIMQTLQVVPPNGERSLTDRGFTINASNDSIASHSFVQLSAGLIKGYMLIWTPEAADKAGRALAAMQASFKTTGGRALDPGMVSLDDTQRRNLLAGMEVRKAKLSRSGFFVSAKGDVITTVDALQDCSRITLDRDIEATVTARDDASGLALLTPTKTLAPPDVAAFSTNLRIGTEVALAGYSYEDSLPSPTLTFGALEDIKGLNGETGVARLSLAALPGDAGGPVVDGTGAVLGMLVPAKAEAGRVLPEGVSFIANAASVTKLMEKAGITAQTASDAAALPPGDLTDQTVSLTVLVSCWN